MARYQLAKSGVIDAQRNLSIPIAGGNRHYREYRDWIAKGNTPDPATKAPKPINHKTLYAAANTNLKKIDVIAKHLGLV